MRELEALGLPVDRANYELIYSAPFSERIEFLTDRYPLLNRIYQDFNTQHPADYAGRSLSVSDVVVLRCNGDTSTHFVDSVGFVELDNYTFFGEETRQTPVTETPAPSKETDTLFQVETSSDKYNGASVAELEADVKAGKAISLTDLSKAAHAEQVAKSSRGAAPKVKPKLMERLEQGKQKAAQHGQPGAPKPNHKEERE
jgi:hypothetical protein